MKILIVEDEMIISEDICMMLESNDYIVSDQSVDYDDAIASFQDNKPDLVLLDINLKGTKTGIDVARFINQNGKVPFVYTSSLTDSNTIDQAKETRPSSYLVKPFNEEQLIAAIEIAMSNFSKESVPANTQDDVVVFNDAIFIKDGHRFSKTQLSDILYINKSDNYIDIYTVSKRFTIRATMSGFMKSLSYSQLFRTHKSYAVNIDYITEITSTMVFLGKKEIPLSKVYSDLLKSKLRVF